MPDRAARRLIALLGHLRPGARIPIAALAEALDVSETELVKDLLTLSLCGLPPFTPDTLMPLIVEDGYVEVWSALPAPVGTVRLSHSEATALAAALQTAGVSANDPLLRKLLDAMAHASFDDETLAATIRAAVSQGRATAVHATIALARARGEVVRIEYQASGERRVRSRDIEPSALFFENGSWYVTAWCRKADGWRTFRLDRVRSARLTGETFDPRRVRPEPPRALPLERLPRALLLFQQAAEFSDRDWPGAEVVEIRADGSALISVPYAGTRWLSRRVLARLGSVEVLEPAGLRAAVARLAAEERASLLPQRSSADLPNRSSIDAMTSEDVSRCT